MDYALSALQYLGIATTGLLAILSLFFKFVDETNPSRRRLTGPGRWALAVIVLGIATSVVSTAMKEISDGRRQQAAQTENARLAAELRLTSETFNTLALHLTYAQPLDWRARDFLGPDRNQQITGQWYDGASTVLADWMLTKDENAPVAYAGYKAWEMQYVETRKPEIDSFVRQNPDLARLNLHDLELVSAPGSTVPYVPEIALFFGHSTFASSATHVDVDVASPKLRARYSHEMGVTITTHTNIKYSDLIGTKLAVSYRFHSPSIATTDGLTLFTVTPSEIPPSLTQIQAVDVLLNGQRVARAFVAGRDTIKPVSKTVRDRQKNVFTADLVRDFVITREMLIDNYRPRG